MPTGRRHGPAGSGWGTRDPGRVESPWATSLGGLGAERCCVGPVWDNHRQMSAESLRPSPGDPAAVGVPGSGERGGQGGAADAGGVGSGARLVAGRYRLGSVLGRGAMGTVWAATDEVLQRRVAIKQVTLSPGLPVGEAAQLRQRALREARAVAALSSPYIITVFDVLTVNGEPVIVMELLPSRSLAEVLGQVGPVDRRAGRHGRGGRRVGVAGCARRRGHPSGRETGERVDR